MTSPALAAAPRTRTDAKQSPGRSVGSSGAAGHRWWRLVLLALFVTCAAKRCVWPGWRLAVFGVTALVFSMSMYERPTVTLG